MKWGIDNHAGIYNVRRMRDTVLFPGNGGSTVYTDCTYKGQTKEK